MLVRCGVLTVSDRSTLGITTDLSGPAVIQLIRKQGWQIAQHSVVPDEIQVITTKLIDWSDKDRVDIIFTVGGTGFSMRDVTPEATSAVIDRLAPGLAETMRAESLKKTPHAMLSRAVAGMRKQTLIINLPGSINGAIENLQIILPALPHAVQLLRDDPDAEADHKV